jgi:VWFA-related protein
MRRLAAAVLSVLLLAPPPAWAQSTKLVESIEVRVTNIDVVVTDKSGNPIYGLGKDDFEIYENNVQQPISNFYEVRADAIPDANSARPGATPPPDTTALAPDEVRQRRIIFFVDNGSLHPMRRNEVFQSIEKFLDRLFQHGDQAMLVTWNRGLRIVVPFTDDKEKLRRALHNTGRVSGGGVAMNADKERLQQGVQLLIDQARQSRSSAISVADAYDQALSMVRNYADNLYSQEKALAGAMSTMLTTLAGLEGKKVMVFTGSHLPDKPGLDMFQWLDQQFSAQTRVAPAAFRESNRYSVTADLEKVAKQANANNVTIYMIDGADPTHGSTASAESTQQLDPSVDFMDFTNTANAFGTIAKLTGGIALLRTNNFDLALSTVARDLGSYYSLGYKPGDDKPGNKKIAVKTKNRELRVRSRQSYVAKSADEQTQDRVISNAFHSQVKSEIPVTLVVSGQPSAVGHGQWKVPLRITFPSNLTLLPDGNNNLVGGFSVYFAVIDENGSMSAVSKRDQEVKLPKSAEAALRSKPISFRAEVTVKPGEHYISVGIIDNVASSAGYARTRIAAR